MAAVKTQVSAENATESGLLQSAELAYLNHNASRTPAISASLEQGYVSRFAIKLRTRFRSMMFPELETSDSRFNEELVRLLNRACKKLDTHADRAEDVVAGSIYAAEKRVMTNLDEAVQRLQNRIDHRAVDLDHFDARLRTVEAVAEGVERIVANLGSEQRSESLASANNGASQPAVDYSYLLLENRFRGDEAEISQRLQIYPKIFANAALPVLEIGAGRGELQRLFREAKVPSYGVDLDRAMVERSREQGFDVRLENALSHLESAADCSLGGVIAIQVIEHLSRGELRRLIELCRAKVAHGGRLVFETINTESLVALSRNYYRDPTHVMPIHPETVAFSIELLGLKVLELRKLAPFPEGAALRRVEFSEYMTPRWISAIESLNHNFKQLNDLLYGFQDYCVIAEVP